MTFKTGTFYNRSSSRWTGDIKHIIKKGSTVTEAMNDSGIGNIGLAFAEDVCRVPDGLGEFQETVADKRSLWLNRVPWTSSGLQDLDRKVEWYNGLSNSEYGGILDQLTDQYRLDSIIHAGKRGEFVIFQFKMPEFSIDKDPNGGHSALLTIAENRHNGSKYFGTTITRLFCVNQFNNLGRDMKAMPSGQDAALILDFQVKVEQSRIQQIQQLNDLFTKPVSKTNVDELANVLFPTPKPRRIIKDISDAVSNGYDMGQDNKTTNRMNKKEKEAVRDYAAAIGRHEDRVGEFNDLFVRYENELGANKYALWQTATDQMSHSEHFKSSSDRQQLNLMFGDTGKVLQNAWWEVVNG